MNTKNISILVVSGAVLMGVSFYGGIKYQEGKIPNFQNLTAAERQQIFQQGGIGARGARTGTGANIPRNGAGMNSTVGEVISMDDKSITVKFRDGGSKIVFFPIKPACQKQQKVLKLML